MSKGTYVMDFSDFDKKFMDIVKAEIPRYGEHGIREALDELKNDADDKPPRTPHKEGHLRGSGRVVNVKNIARELSGEVKYGGSGMDMGGVEFNVPYAHRWHEAEPGTVEWSEPDVGPKYLESKAVRYAKKYAAIIAETIRRKKK